MDRRSHGFRARAPVASGLRDSASDLLTTQYDDADERRRQSLSLDVPSLEVPLPLPETLEEDMVPDNATSTGHSTDHATETADTFSDAHSISDSLYDAQIREDLEKRWILNLSMHFKDHSRREKFFVTYRQSEHIWRRVTVSLDYRNAPPNSLEMDLIHTKFQRDKNQKIFEAIRESLLDIHFFDTVTNLKLETTDGRLHVHVVEDGNEIIPYPPVSQVAHLGCRRVSERDVEFDSHMSGFVYKVKVGGEILIKKEIPSPETIEEFLYEINALNSLTYSENVINFHGVVVDEYDEYVKGLLISFADGGALIDVIYDNCKEPSSNGLAWSVRERWARQIVGGLADIHESGFVQGDFTLSNIVIDDKDDAKIIDINRRGCPVGWEPPEATPLLDSNHRISMYIGIKSDLYQLGMVLWALAMEDDEPDLEARPLLLGPEAKVPEWYRILTETCLNPDPRKRLQASQLTKLFPPPEEGRLEHISVDDGLSLKSYYVDECSTVRPPGDWPHYNAQFLPNGPPAYESWNYPPRGRSPPSPLPSNPDMSESHHGPYSPTAWAARRFIRPSYSDAGVEDIRPEDMGPSFTPTPTADRIEFPEGELRLDEDEADEHPSADDISATPKDTAPADEKAEEGEATPKANIGDESASSISVDKDTLEAADKAGGLAPVENKASEHDDLEKATKDGNEVSNGHIPEVEDSAGVEPPLETNALEPELEKDIDSVAKAAEDVTTEGATAGSDNVVVTAKEEPKVELAAAPDTPETAAADSKAAQVETKGDADDDDDDVVEQHPNKGIEPSTRADDLKEGSGEDKVDADATKDAIIGTPTEIPERPEAQAESAPDNDVALPNENGHSATQVPEIKPAELAEQTPGQQAMPASESCPPAAHQTSSSSRESRLKNVVLRCRQWLRLMTTRNRS